MSLPLITKKLKERQDTRASVEGFDGATDLRDGAATPGGKAASKADRPGHKVVKQLRDGVRTVVKDIGDNVRKLTGLDQGKKKQKESNDGQTGEQTGGQTGGQDTSPKP